MPRLAILLFLILLLTGCAATEQYAPVRDLTEYTQDAGAYHGKSPHTRLLPPDVQQAAYDDFMTAFFAPWERTDPAHPASDVFWGFTVYGGKDLFGENTLPRDSAWMKRMAVASRMDEYPSMGRPAIAVTNADIRVLPTDAPAFYDFALAGEGYPFDYMQNSLVLAGTPLYATHMSADQAWVMVETRFAFGWVHVSDIAWVDDPFMTAYRTGNYAALTSDNVPLADESGHHLFMGEVGMLLPISQTDGSLYTLLVPARNHNGNAVLKRVAATSETVCQAPLPATPANFTLIANAMLGRAYGWGGFLGNRDCSALTMDLMTVFGIALPRNSSQQIKVGEQIELEGLDRDEKEAIIVKRGIPFLTLVRKPGHIMLYIGSRDGHPVVMHAVWGLKTETSDGYGRKIIGRAAITSLTPGLELNNLARPEGILLETVSRISILP